MEKNELPHILNDWNFWEHDLNMEVFRDTYLNMLNELLPSRQIKIITGARRSGKPFIMRQIILA